MKGSQRVLDGMDKLSDDAAEMRDISDDVRSALSSMAESATDPSIDEDDLLMELDQLIMGDAPEALPESRSSSNGVVGASQIAPTATSTYSTPPSTNASVSMAFRRRIECMFSRRDEISGVRTPCPMLCYRGWV